MYWRRGWQLVPPARPPLGATSTSSAAAFVGVFALNHVHLAAQAVARAGPPAHHVGLPPGRRDHLPAGLRLGPLRDRAGRPARATAPSSSGSRPFAFRASSRSSGILIFHGLVWSSFLVIAGVHAGAAAGGCATTAAAALQDFQEDLLPLFLLFAISVTGLLLTVSYTWMKGYGYDFLAILHAVTVIFTLLWLPFGKFFHIFQRPAQLGVKFYRDVGRQERAGGVRAAAASRSPRDSTSRT